MVILISNNYPSIICDSINNLILLNVSPLEEFISFGISLVTISSADS